VCICIKLGKVGKEEVITYRIVLFCNNSSVSIHQKIQGSQFTASD